MTKGRCGGGGGGGPASQFSTMSLTHAHWWCATVAQALGASGKLARPLWRPRLWEVSPYIAVWINCGSSRRGELLQRLRPTRLSPPRRPPPLTPASARARPSRASHQQPHKLVILRVPAAPPWSYPLRCLHSLRWRATQSSSCARRTDNAAVRPPASAASAHTRLAAVRLRAAAALCW